MKELPLPGIAALYTDVHEFHRVFDHPAHFSPVLQPADRVAARADWLDEEVGELREARTIYDQADAYIDIIYFAVGGLVEIGVDPSELWRIVHGANMAKVQPDGTVHRRPDGKIIKPSGWRAPDEAIAEEVNRQIEASLHSPLFDTHFSDAPAMGVQAVPGVYSEHPGYRDADAPIPPAKAMANAVEDDGTADRLRTLHESGRAAVRAAMHEEPRKAPPAPGTRYKPDGFA